MSNLPWRWILGPIALAFVTPSLVILALETLVARRGVGQALADIARRQFAEGENLFLLALIGSIRSRARVGRRLALHSETTQLWANETNALTHTSRRPRTSPSQS